MKKISIVVPLFNEQDSLKELYSELKINISNYEYEIIFIDDGSYDNSWSILKDICKNDEKIKVIKFHNNYGKSDALSEGFKYALGEIVITIDSDLQDDPNEIPRLVSKIEEGWDVVSGWKKNRKDPISKKFPSKFFNFVTGLFTGIKIHDFNCGLKAYRKKVIKALDV